MKTLALLMTMMAMLTPLPHQDDSGKDDKSEQIKKPVGHKKEPTTRKKPRLRGMHAQMAKVCGMSEEQQEELIRLNAKRYEAWKQFKTSTTEKLKVLQARIAEARKNNDKEALKEAYSEIRSLRIKQREIYEHWKAKMMAILTPEQKARWDRYQAMLAIKRRFKSAGLTAEQMEKIEAAYTKFVVGAGPSDKKARREALKKLNDYIRTEILTDAQRKATTRPARKTTTRPKHYKEQPKTQKDKPAKIKDAPPDK